MVVPNAGEKPPAFLLCQALANTAKIRYISWPPNREDSPMNTTVAVQLPADAMRRLQELATRNGCSQAEYISDAVLEHLADLEAFQVAEQRMHDLESGKSDSVPLAQMMKEHGMED